MNAKQAELAKESFERLLCHGGVRVLIDGESDGVVLPAGLRKPIVIEYELEPVVPIPDLVVDDDGIHATLSFSREPRRTFVPWSGVVAIAPMRPEQLAVAQKRAALRSV